MQIVIDIPEILYTKIQNGKADKRTLETVILHGTPLPKGHGKLIDADAELEGLRKMKVVDEKDKQSVRFSILNFETAPTIIEADTESEDK